MPTKKYKHIFFDLDHTLWDFETNSNQTLRELTDKYGLHTVPEFDMDECIRAFHEANHSLWEQYNKGEITTEQLRSYRFDRSFGKYDFGKDSIKARFNEDYMATCPHKANLMPEAREILEFLYREYFNLYVLTNGFEHIQLIKLTASQMFHYFENVYTTKDSGHRKPQKEYFEYVLRDINASPSECLMIGDSVEIDVLAAMNTGIDGVWYNPKGERHDLVPTYTISNLMELKDIVWA